MATEIRLPHLGKEINEATVVGFSVRIGDRVKKGDVVFEVEADKATLEVESPADGFVKHIFARPGRTLQVGQPVLILGARDEQLPKSLINALSSAAETQTPVSVAETPAAGWQLAETGEADLGKTTSLSRLQRISAERMTRSKREIPCFYLTVRADVTDLVDLRAELNRAGDVEVSYNDFVIRAVALGLEKFPLMTGRFEGDAVRLASSIDIALAVAVSDGLVAPVVKDANKKTVAQIARQTGTLIERARANKLGPAELEGACTTISNLGSFGIESFIPIVIPGQCSILGVGRIIETCVPDLGVHSGRDQADITVRKLMSLTLSVDHRIANGTYASRFLDFVRKILQDPAALR